MTTQQYDNDGRLREAKGSPDGGKFATDPSLTDPGFDLTGTDEAPHPYTVGEVEARAEALCNLWGTNPNDDNDWLDALAHAEQEFKDGYRPGPDPAEDEHAVATGTMTEAEFKARHGVTPHRCDDCLRVTPHTALDANSRCPQCATEVRERPVYVDDLRQSVLDYRDPATSEQEREHIRSWWAEQGVANQFAASLRAAEFSSEYDRARVVLGVEATDEQVTALAHARVAVAARWAEGARAGSVTPWDVHVSADEPVDLADLDVYGYQGVEVSPGSPLDRVGVRRMDSGQFAVMGTTYLDAVQFAPDEVKADWDDWEVQP